MIVVRVELWSAITGLKTELARMHICNDGTGTPKRGNYFSRVFRGRGEKSLDSLVVHKQGYVSDHPRKNVHVWNLVAKMLNNMEYGK